MAEGSVETVKNGVKCHERENITDLFHRLRICYEGHGAGSDAYRQPGYRVGRDRGGKTPGSSRARAGRDILSLCLFRLEPRVPIHLLCPDPPG